MLESRIFSACKFQTGEAATQSKNDEKRYYRGEQTLKGG
jgi:hypothetical protein